MDTTQRCRTCKHWDGLTRGTSTDTEQRPCNHPELAVSVYGWNTENEYIALAVEPGRQPLFTGPDFGCVHWEGKE